MLIGADDEYDYISEERFTFVFTNESAIPTPQNVSIQINDDNTVERDETIIIRLRDVSEMRAMITFANIEAPLTIEDDDSKCDHHLNTVPILC